MFWPASSTEKPNPWVAAHSDTGLACMTLAGASGLASLAKALLMRSNMACPIPLKWPPLSIRTLEGTTMIDVYTWATPNGHKVQIMLEECGLAYAVHPVNIGAGDQFRPEFLAISPNNKIP